MSLISWFNLELWGPVWPNLAASALCTTVGVLRIRTHLVRHHRAQAQQHAQTREMMTALTARLGTIGPAGESVGSGQGE